MYMYVDYVHTCCTCMQHAHCLWCTSVDNTMLSNLHHWPPCYYFLFTAVWSECAGWLGWGWEWVGHHQPNLPNICTVCRTICVWVRLCAVCWWPCGVATDWSLGFLRCFVPIPTIPHSLVGYTNFGLGPKTKIGMSCSNKLRNLLRWLHVLMYMEFASCGALH